jgi:superfamily II DNA or RNA helicase
MPNIFDNINAKFEEGLRTHIEGADRVDYCVGYFNLRGWKSVSDKVDELHGATVREGDTEEKRYCRLLVGMSLTPKQELREEFGDPDEYAIDNDKASRCRKKLAKEFAEQLTLGVPTTADEQVLRHLIRQLRTDKVKVKLFLRHQLHAKLYLSYHTEGVTPKLGLLGSSNFTLAGISKQGELNIDVIEQDAATKLEAWFEDRWNDRWCIDITKDLIEVLNLSWAREETIPPYNIYLKIAYHLSQEARAGLSEFTLPKRFHDELLEFQQAAVKIAAHHLNKRNGVIIGDVVGLGKTITATAVAKMLEEDLNYNTLIICPKNLVSMWREDYVHEYDLRAKVLSQSMITRELPEMRRYKLVIIDESHNFSNNEGTTYRALKSYLDENESKVILLSATPYNKSYSDLANQLKLFLPEDYDLGITPEHYIQELGGVLRFHAKHTDTNIRTIKAFEKSDKADDWREVMKLYLVRRTRSFIKQNYAEYDDDKKQYYLIFSTGEISYFPERIPKKVEFKFKKDEPTDQYAALYSDNVLGIINGLTLPRYGLLQYYDNKSTPLSDDEQLIIDNLSRAGNRVIGFFRSTMFKRLESSGYSFLLSVSRHLLRNYCYIYAIENEDLLPVIGQVNDVDILDLFDDDDNQFDDGNSGYKYDWTEEDFMKAAKKYYIDLETKYKSRFKWLSKTRFSTKPLMDALRNDNENLMRILQMVGEWRPEEDRKLIALRKLLTQTHKKDKMLIFTQFANTAEYLKENLEDDISELDVAIGGHDNIPTLVKRFSPISNHQRKIDKELRVLITTDVLSEGQNLQDAHIIINFDLPWAIVRLIQRAGRVDRIGQQASKILCYSFLPEDGINDIIRLRDRLRRRISENAEVVGSDEVFFDGDPVNIKDLYNEKSGIFDEEEDTEVDIASYAYQIWKNATESDAALRHDIEELPNVVYSAKENDSKGEDGVILYARTKEDNDVLTRIDTEGNIVTQSQYAILRAAECEPDAPALTKLSNHHELVADGIEAISKDETITGGNLGRKHGIRYRTYTRLETFYDENVNTLFVTDELKKAMDDIYSYPLRESAIDTISRQMKAGISDFDLANLVVSLKQDGRLCSIPDEDSDIKQTQIICSLGLVGRE